MKDALADHREEKVISLLAISASNLGEINPLQLELPLAQRGDGCRPGTKKGMARQRADRAVDAIRDRFGRDVVSYASVSLGAVRSVPDAFRELAEKQL